ncbi:MAG: hypothetical protein HOO96_44820 [Polyangiaceae bacterium]|nr:hypothetical protein [Polyangiaceae bacterium]
MRRPITVLSLLVMAFACARAEPPITKDSETFVRTEPERSEVPRHLGMLVAAPEPPPSQCEPGQTRSCPEPGVAIPPIQMHCVRAATGAWVFNRAECATPLVIAFGPVRFTRPPGNFAVGPFPRTEWVSADSPWLAIDRNGNGCVDDARELFGSEPGHATGFDSLAALDANGDARLDADDPAFATLRLWFDENQDRTCQPGEMRPLTYLGLTMLDLHTSTRRPTAMGSFEGEAAEISRTDARLVDVYLAPMD